MKVLIVDSSEEIIGRLDEMLSELNSISIVYKAKNCIDALIEVKKNIPDIILLDVNLHNNASFKCARQIKLYHKEIVIIALVNNTEKKDKFQRKNINIEIFLDKYHEFEKIPEAIQLIFNKKDYN